MKPRIEKKLSKRLVEIAPSVFGDAWIDNEWEHWPKHYAHDNGGVLNSKQRRQNLQQRVSVNHVPSVGGGVDYWGEGNDWWTCWAWLRMNWEWYGPFEAYPDGHRFCGYPNTEGFKATTRNILKLLTEYEARLMRGEQC